MKTWTVLAILVLGVIAGLGGHFFLLGSEAAPAAPPGGNLLAMTRPDRVAANGVVEGARPEVALRAEIAGMLVRVCIKENQDVQKGQLLAEMSNESQKEQVALAEADATTARAERDKVKNGERAERRRAVAAVEAAKLAMFRQAENDWKRSERLARERSTSAEQHEGDYFRMIRTKADWEQAAAERALVEAPPRPDELAAAESRVAAAEARLRIARAELAKTRLLAPSAGRVLQVYAEPGEMASPTNAQPILLLADLSKRRVRAFIEELDVTRVQNGQRATVTADGLPGREFAGTVSLVLPRMGKRAPLSDSPGEYKDLYFREVLIDLTEGNDLPLNLRVQARIQVEVETK